VPRAWFEIEGGGVPSKGSGSRAEGNQTLRTVCANCGHSLPTEVGHAHPLDESIRRETWGLVGYLAGQKTVFPTCAACREAGWRPPGFVWMN
jgi:hypothetical protein